MSMEDENKKYDLYQIYAEWEGYQGYHLIPRVKIEMFLQYPIFVYIAIGVTLVVGVGIWMIAWKRKRDQESLELVETEKDIMQVVPILKSSKQKEIELNNTESDTAALIKT